MNTRSNLLITRSFLGIINVWFALWNTNSCWITIIFTCYFEKRVHEKIILSYDTHDTFFPKFVSKDQIGNSHTLAQTMACCLTEYKPVAETMATQFNDGCMLRKLQWINVLWKNIRMLGFLELNKNKLHWHFLSKLISTIIVIGTIYLIKATTNIFVK